MICFCHKVIIHKSTTLNIILEKKWIETMSSLTLICVQPLSALSWEGTDPGCMMCKNYCGHWGLQTYLAPPVPSMDWLISNCPHSVRLLLFILSSSSTLLHPCLSSNMRSKVLWQLNPLVILSMKDYCDAEVFISSVLPPWCAGVRYIELENVERQAIGLQVMEVRV